VAPLPALAVPPGFLHRATPTVAPHTAPTSTAAPRVAPASSAAPTVVPDGPPPREWLASPIAYVRCLRQPAPAGTTPPPPLRPPPTGGQGVVVPVTPLENPQRMVTRAPTSSLANGSSRTSSALTGPLIATRLVGSFGFSLSPRS
jgi:hypothetical protein